MRKDLILHFAVCFVIALAVASYQYCLYGGKQSAMSAAFFAYTAAAFTKEWADDVYCGGWDWLDLCADFIGGTLALFLFALFI